MTNKASAWTIILGIILPTITFLVELTSGFCAENLFDPIPRWPLMIGVGAVPVIFFVYWKKKQQSLQRIPDGLVNTLVAATLPISAYYAIVFGPILPIAAFGIILYGMGLLPLTPVFTFIIGIFAIRRELAPGKFRYHWLGVAGGLLFLLLVEGPSWITYSQINRLAKDNSPETLESAAKVCRLFGSNKCLRLNSSNSFNAPEPVSFVWDGNLSGRSRRQTTSRNANLLHFYVTGKAVNQAHNTQGFATRGGRWNWDSNLGGDTVGTHLPGLSLEQSVISSKVETASGLIYQEWTVKMRNEAFNDQEGRALIKLPKGSVVSRLTLWVNGEPKEAAFAKKEKVTAAYKSVAIQQRRDPVLVRWAGPDRIFVQCFPVPRDGGFLKYRIGFISPLDENGNIVPPRILEQNFTIKDSFDHTLRFQSDRALNSLSTELDVAPHPKGGSVLMGQLRHKELNLEKAIGTAEFNPRSNDVVWAKDNLDSQKRPIVRRPNPEQEASKRENLDLVIVLDGSASVKPYAKEIAETIKAASALANKTSLVIANRRKNIIIDSTSETVEKMAATVKAHKYQGGIDNASALVSGITISKLDQPTNIIWIHGPQPVGSKPSSAIQVLNALSVKPKVKIHSFSTVEGENYLLRKLMTSPALLSAQSAIDIKQSVLETIHPKTENQYFWNHISDSSDLPENAVEVSNTLARYWAFQKVKSKLLNDEWDRNDTEFAAKYQLVTPFTGAVVLETQQQFDAHGLSPVDADSTTTAPSVPEPEFYLLLLITALIAFWMNRKRLPQLCPIAR